MGWYAGHIFAKPTQEVISLLCSHPLLSKTCMLLKTLLTIIGMTLANGTAYLRMVCLL
jgi:hypothetical protein